MYNHFSGSRTCQFYYLKKEKYVEGICVSVKLELEYCGSIYKDLLYHSVYDNLGSPADYTSMYF